MHLGPRFLLRSKLYRERCVRAFLRVQSGIISSRLRARWTRGPVDGLERRFRADLFEVVVVGLECLRFCVSGFG